MANIQYGLPMFSPISPYPMLMQEPYNAIVFNNVADFLDPTPYADMNLAYRKGDARVVNTIKFANNMQNSGLTAPPTNISIFGEQLFG